jgi:hypothetical protein
MALVTETGDRLPNASVYADLDHAAAGPAPPATSPSCCRSMTCRRSRHLRASWRRSGLRRAAREPWEN